MKSIFKLPKLLFLLLLTSTSCLEPDLELDFQNSNLSLNLIDVIGSWEWRANDLTKKKYLRFNHSNMIMEQWEHNDLENCFNKNEGDRFDSSNIKIIANTFDQFVYTRINGTNTEKITLRRGDDGLVVMSYYFGESTSTSLEYFYSLTFDLDKLKICN